MGVGWLHGGGFPGRPMGELPLALVGGGGPGPCLQTSGTLRRAQLDYLLSLLEFLCSHVPGQAAVGSPRAGLREASAVEGGDSLAWPHGVGPMVYKWPSSREKRPRGCTTHPALELERFSLVVSVAQSCLTTGPPWTVAH